MIRDLPLTLPSEPTSRSVRFRLQRAASAALVFALIFAMFGFGTGRAQADEYDDQANNSKQIEQQQHQIDEVSAALMKAVSDSQVAKGNLAKAQVDLDNARKARTAAQAEDTKRAKELSEAQAALQSAQEAVKKGQQDLENQRLVIGGIARSVYQQNAPMTGLAFIMAAKTTDELSDRMKWNKNSMNSAAHAMDELNATQKRLQAAEAAQAKAENDATKAKQASADALSARQAAEQTATDNEAALASASKLADQAAATLDSQLAVEKSHLEALQKDRDAISQRIRERQAREAEAARQEAARQEAERQAAAAQQQAQSQEVVVPPVQQEQTPPAASTAFIMPVVAPITSPYGMRIHPIMGIPWFHDGTDLGASCGTPIRAAAAGYVAEMGWSNAGYGNRLILESTVNGVNYTTGYNHAEYYIVGVGQWVNQGDVLGYIGTTGVSTGCHLHYQMWVNGTMIDPMTMY